MSVELRPCRQGWMFCDGDCAKCITIATSTTTTNPEKIENCGTKHGRWTMADREMTSQEAIEILGGIRACYNIFDGYDEPKYAALSKAIFALKAVPVVRCKDCVYYTPEVDDPHKSTCQRLWGGMTECNADSYCSCGVRKDEAEDGI